MTPEQMSERLAAWERACPASHTRRRRVVCVEDEGPRRTWTLWDGAIQVGHVRGRQGPSGEWTWEAANAGLDVLRALDDMLRAETP